MWTVGMGVWYDKHSTTELPDKCRPSYAYSTQSHCTWLRDSLTGLRLPGCETHWLDITWLRDSLAWHYLAQRLTHWLDITWLRDSVAWLDLAQTHWFDITWLRLTGLTSPGSDSLTGLTQRGSLICFNNLEHYCVNYKKRHYLSHSLIQVSNYRQCRLQAQYTERQTVQRL